MDRYRVAVVIPALNEAASIAKVIDGVTEYGVPVVVDDGSSDGTAQIARSRHAQVVTHSTNRGYDAALASGFAHAKELGFEYAITVDADGQHNPALLKDFVSAFESGAEIVLGRRDRYQRAAEFLFACVARGLWGIPDPLCGMKGYSMHVYDALGHFDSYQSIGTELAIFAARSGRKIAHVTVVTRDRMGVPRFGRRLSANWRILRALVLGVRKAVGGTHLDQRRKDR